MSPEKQAVVDLLVSTTTLDDLRNWVYESHKDIYGMRGRWATKASAHECADWIARHFEMTTLPDGTSAWQFNEAARALAEFE
jgi:hypothetical protein